MFLKKITENLRSFFTIFAVLTAVLLYSANTTNAQRGTYLDFTGDNKSDWALRSDPTATGTPISWKILRNPASPVPNQAFIRIVNFGVTGTDVPTPRDFIGDSKTELAVYRPGTAGLFFVAPFPEGTGGVIIDRVIQFGRGGAGTITDDNPDATGDYDGDGKIDYAVSRINTTTLRMTYYIMSSATGTMSQVDFGLPPFTGSVQLRVFNGADFNGDGRDELVLALIAENGDVTWSAGDAITGAEMIRLQFGNFDTDYIITPANYTGDSRADFVVFRATLNPGVWFINDTATNTTTATQFGIGSPTFAGNDFPIRGDYDGDGRQDIAVYRNSNNTFYVLQSSNGGQNGQTWGGTGDTPLGRIGTF